MDGFVSKSEELNRIIEKLYTVSSEADCGDICNDFDSIYMNPDGSLNKYFRHEYSSISGKIRELNEVELDGTKVYVLEYLLDNINSVYDYACQHKKPYIQNLFKLKDHIGLEAGRIALVEQLKWEINNDQESVKVQLERMNDFANSIGNQIHDSTELMGELKELEKANAENIAESKKNLDELNDLSESVKQKAEGVQRDSITILGIFASIVLTFTGGMIFSTSVLENMGNASAYRIIIIALIIGFALVNSIIALIMYIGKIVHIKSKNGKGVKAFLSENIFWIIVNTIFISLIAVTYIGWITSSEKDLLDESNKYQIELYHRNTEELKADSISEKEMQEPDIVEDEKVGEALE